MKKVFRILIPIILAIAIILCIAWYLFVYDREFTRDALLYSARFFESKGSHEIASWFYDRAYSHAGNNDAVAIELAEQYKSFGNYTKAEFTLRNAIEDGGGVDLYIALCKTFVEQDKLKDAVTMLDTVTNPQIKAQLDALRPKAPTSSPAEGTYSQYISVTLKGEGGTIYADPTGVYPSQPQDLYTKEIALVDGLNDIYAVTIADNGLVSPLSVFKYTVGGVVEKMTFSDKAIEAEARKLLGVGEKTVLYTNNLWTIKSFTVPAEATSYKDLKYFAFLEELVIENGKTDQLSSISALEKLASVNISNTPISAADLASITALPNLRDLRLSGCGLSSITGLDKAANLVSLDLSNNTVRNIDPISHMAALEKLNLRRNALVDLSALSALSKLSELDVSENALVSVAPLSRLGSLRKLYAGSNQITQVDAISALIELTHLDISNNQVSDVVRLVKCTELQELNISKNKLTSIEKLSALNKLTKIDFSDNQVSALPLWEKSCALITIIAANNKLSSVANLSGLQHLNNLDVQNNINISSVDALADCPVLIQVNAYGTKVRNAYELTKQDIIVLHDTN